MSDKKVPRWVTSWPEWFGVHGNVEVVPASDYDALRTPVSEIETIRITEVVGADGKGVAAPCAIDGCAVFKGRATLVRLRSQRACKCPQGSSLGDIFRVGGISVTEQRCEICNALYKAEL